MIKIINIINILAKKYMKINFLLKGHTFKSRMGVGYVYLVGCLTYKRISFCRETMPSMWEMSMEHNTLK
jgi:hypothetical protein